MNVKRVFYIAAVGMGAFLTQGCSVDATPTLPSFNVNYNFPLVGGAPIIGELFLPSIDTCETLSEEALLAAVEDSDAATFFVKLLLDTIDIEEVSLVNAVMEATEPEGASFEGLTEVTFLENDRVILSATDGDGIIGNRIELSTDNPINLIDVIEACPERASTIRVKVEGLVPVNSPTQWRTTVTVRVRASVSLF